MSDVDHDVPEDARWREEPKEPLPLVDAAALRIAGNHNLTLGALRVVPHGLFPVLLAASLDTDLVVATKAIVAAWPLTTLSFRSLQKFTRLSRIKHVQRQQHHDGPALVVAMAISEQKDNRVQFIDITALKLSERTEVQFLETLLKGREGSLTPPKKKRKPQSTQSDYPSLQIIMDSTINGEKSAEYLQLQSRLQDCNIHVLHRKLIASNCGLELVERVLGSIDLEGTSELNIGYNSLQNSGLMRALQLVQALPRLTTLAIHYNRISVLGEHADGAISALGSALASLPLLRSLKLTGNRLTRRLAEILRGVQKPLFHLDLSACMLAADDILYLGGSHHAPHLRHLFLRDNPGVGANAQGTEQLLRKASGSLVELDLQMTRPGDNSDKFLSNLTELAPKFTKLRCLAIHDNNLGCRDQVHVALAFARCPSMRQLHLSFPTVVVENPWECYRGHKLTARISPNSEQTAAVWFMLTCWTKIKSVAPNCCLGRSPVMVQIYDEEGVIEVPGFEFPIPCN